MKLPFSWTASRCPRCGSNRLRRSARRSYLERVVGVLSFPWRCEDCYFRFFSLRRRGDVQHAG